MEKFYKKSVGLAFAMLIAATMAFAQTTITGTVKDDKGEALPGVNVTVKGTISGTITDVNGNFTLKNQNPPITLIFSFIGYKAQEVQVDASNSTLNVILESAASELAEVIITGPRQPESWLKSSTTVEVMTLQNIKEASTIDPYDALSQMKGVQTTSSSMNFQQINTRGFATIANERFVQWVDGIDTSAPILNFPTGNIVGIGELDMESMELIPGAASALYGPNAFNGILIMKSKSPFEYQGLSAQFKGGFTTSDAQGNKANPMYNFGFRYAKSISDKVAVKVNFSIFDATDWRGNDYKTDRLRSDSEVDLSGTTDFDGLNLYGDEAAINITGFPTLRRTGFREEEIVDSYSAKSIKGDVALHYRITPKIEALVNYRYGSGNAIYQGDSKYALRDFTQQFFKLEVRGTNFFVRGYQTATDAGNSYNLLALGSFINERYSPSATNWVPDYLNAFFGNAPGVAGNDHNAARKFADRNRVLVNENIINDVRNDYFQRRPAGAKFTDDSKINHAEFNYNFADQIDFAEVMVGGNVRQYDLFTDGTILNEDPDAEDPANVDFGRIKIFEYGAYTQIAKTLGSIKLTGSVRYDKNENFDGQVTPRIAAVYDIDDKHHIRASFQTGFRNPQTQAQFIYFPGSDATLLGSTEANAGSYGVHNGGSYTLASYRQFLANGGSLAADGTPQGTQAAIDLLVETNVPYVQPEQLKAFEVGYKGALSNLTLDVNAYYNIYNDFIGTDLVAAKFETTHQGVTSAPGKAYSLYSNSPETVQSYGVGLGANYSIGDFVVSGNYNFADFTLDEVEGRVFNAGFNTPNHKFNIGVANRKLLKSNNLGFSINYRWQEEFEWFSSFGTWQVPAFGVIDAQVSYRVAPLKSVFKIGGTNIGGGDYRTNLGGPFVGQQYYVSITFDEFFK